ncbi:MAG: thermonuclease family protein [Spirochaetes bacterium]|nr:thermonuclease family protein [Spirochaetota bacterium]
MRPSLSGVFWLVTLVFIGTSVFFTVNVITFKNRLSDPGGPAEFPSGRKVTVAAIIDGDEISVNMGEARFIVRILGIWSFDATANDTLTQGQGRAAMNYLENTVLNREVELQFDKFRQDENRRVLAFVQMNSADVGYEMVSKGICLVYSKYPFPRMDAYLAAESAAERGKAGLWGDTGIVIRSRVLKKVWDHNRRKKEVK